MSQDLMPIVVGGVMYPATSAYAKELRKFERGPDYNPKNHPFPKMLYHAQERPDGLPSVAETQDSIFGGAPGAAEHFTATCQRVVNDEAEMARAIADGWRETQAQAMESAHARHFELAKQTAHRKWDDRNMSPAAQAEVAAIEEDFEDHLPEIPEQPRRRGRPVGRKNKPKD
jgi:hypothetical protein